MDLKNLANNFLKALKELQGNPQVLNNKEREEYLTTIK